MIVEELVKSQKLRTEVLEFVSPEISDAWCNPFSVSIVANRNSESDSQLKKLL